MVFLYVVELLIAVICVLFMVTQVIVPVCTSTILFPFFRSKTIEAEAEKARLLDEIEKINAEAEVERLKELIDVAKKQSHSSEPDSQTTSL